MDISVIICTYNRCESLRRTLQTCCGLVIPEGVTWELLVVDNNSTDHTKDVCEEFRSRLPIRYLFQPAQGKSHALNLAVVESGGALLLFTDDDVNVPADWVKSYWHTHRQYGEVSFFAGRVVPAWDVNPPLWIQENISSLLGIPFGQTDMGSEPHAIRDEGAGANLGCRRGLFASGLRFRTDIGPGASGEVNGKDKDPLRRKSDWILQTRKRNRVPGEEGDLLRRAADLGFKGLYWPYAVVQHRNNAGCMTRQYVRQWFVEYGTMEARLGQIPKVNVWLGVPRWCWRQLIQSAIRYSLTRWFSRSEKWLKAEINMAKTWGIICELRRQARQRCQP